jgi:DNA-binding MarR family transcriptional regulator
MAELRGKDLVETALRNRKAPRSQSLSDLSQNENAPQIDSLRPLKGISYDLLPSLAGFWLRRLQIKVLKSYEKHLSELELRPVEAAALLILCANSDITQNTLSAALGTDQSTMVGISTRLEKRGFIMRRRQANDRRYQVLNLTPAGRKTTIIVKKRLSAHNKNILRNLSPRERETLLTLLKKVVD